MGIRRKPRRQKVVLRFRHRKAMAERAKRVAKRTFILASIGVGMVALASQGDSFFSHTVKRYTPHVDIRMAQTLTGLPLQSLLPQNPFWLWFPWTAKRVNKRLNAQFPAAQEATFERQFSEKKIIIRLEPRVPLVRWGTSGIDSEGVVFPLQEGRWTQLPKANFTSGIPAPVLGSWIKELSAVPALWETVAGLSDDKYSNLFIDTKTNTRVAWGPMDSKGAPERIASLVRVLEDAHLHLGGAASADLRFFDEGRIIVRPKGIKG